jgi:hypothetical protein
MEMDFKQFGPLDEIAGITCSLTYGEMIDLAAELWKAAGGAEITAKTLPAILHQWSYERAHKPEMPAPANTAFMREPGEPREAQESAQRPVQTPEDLGEAQTPEGPRRGSASGFPETDTAAASRPQPGP